MRHASFRCDWFIFAILDRRLQVRLWAVMQAGSGATEQGGSEVPKHACKLNVSAFLAAVLQHRTSSVCIATARLHGCVAAYIVSCLPTGLPPQTRRFAFLSILGSVRAQL